MSDESDTYTRGTNRSEYLGWLSENVDDFECSRCGAICNGERRKTRFGTVDPGCYLALRSTGKLQQRELSRFVAATDGGRPRQSDTDTNRGGGDGR